jgi:hypothetical protein
MTTNAIARPLRDVGLATWFGGSLMGAIGLNRAAREVDDPRQRVRVAGTGWARWTPVNLGAIAVHGIGAIELARTNGHRVRLEDGVHVPPAAAAQAGLTLAALGATAYSRLLGRKLIEAGDVPVESATKPANETPPEVKRAQRQLRALQWTVPVLTGALLVLTSRTSEERRSSRFSRRRFRRLVPGL